MNTNLFIPQKIKVGYQLRGGTYSGRLAYVIYYDEKNKLRKEASWSSWRDSGIEPDDFDNVPTEGFVLNRNVGGYESHWGNFRQAYVRIYDPRGFEFEITIPNLLYILQYTNSIKGKGLDGEFIYSWDGSDLVLLPCSAPEYKGYTLYSDKMFANKKILAKELKIGATYLTRQNREAVYLGRFDSYGWAYSFNGCGFSTFSKMKKYAQDNNLKLEKVEWGHTKRLFDYKDGTPLGKRYYFYIKNSDKFIAVASLSGYLIDCLAENPDPNYSNLFDRLEALPEYSPYDPSLDKYVPITDYNVFLDTYAKEYRWGFSRIVKMGDNFVNVRIEPTKAATGEKTYSIADLSYFNKSLEDIFNSTTFYVREKYLVNGKLYIRELTL